MLKPRSRFTGGQVSFDGSQFTGGEVSFDGADLTGGTVAFLPPGVTLPDRQANWQARVLMGRE